MPVIHETLRLNHLVPASLDHTWAAFADTMLRARWGVPDGEEQVYLDDDFRTGGHARYRCGTPGVLEFHGDVDYVQVVPRKVVVHTDTVRTADALLATALLTWTFTTSGDNTSVTIVDHVVSFAGPGMIDGHRTGHTAALERLGRMLTA